MGGSRDAEVATSSATVADMTKPDVPAALNVNDEASASNLYSERFGFPKQDGRSLSYWLQTVRCDPLLDHRTTSELPPSADIVIIGSGVSASFTSACHSID